MGRFLALVAALALGVAIAFAAERLPSPRETASSFDPAAAHRDVTAIAQAPHPSGSPANAAVRDYLIRRMAELGLSPQVRPVTGIHVRSFDGRASITGGRAENLVGVLPGRDRGAPAVALMAHYDSAAGSPGAADDAAGVSVALQTIEALRAEAARRGPPVRDVIIVLTDGEEAALLGADGFFRDDPLARRIGFLLNFEARGSAGRTLMFQTGPQNGAAVALLARVTPRPAANSLLGFVYERMPNDTDFTEALAAGVPGFNYAFLGGQFDYHAATSTPERLDTATLRHMGVQALAVTRELAYAPALPGRAPSVAYANLFGDVMVAYPPQVGWLILLAAAVLIVLALGRARRAEPFPWTDVVRGAGAGLFVLLAAGAVLRLARLATGASYGWMEQRLLLAQADRWEVAVMLLGLGVTLFAAAETARGRRWRAALIGLGAAVGCCLFSRGVDPIGVGLGLAAAVVALLAYGRSIARPGAWAGVLLLGLVLASVTQALAAPVAPILAWPLLAGAIGAALSTLAARRSYAQFMALALIGGVVIGWLGGLAHLLFLGLDMPEALAPVALLAALVLWPLAQPIEGAPSARTLGPTLLVVGAVIVGVVRFDPPWSARHPQASQVTYHIDQDTGRAWRVSTAPASAWSRAVLRADGGVPDKVDLWPFGGEVDAAPATALRAEAPEISLERRPDGRILLRARPPSGARILGLRIRPDAPVSAVGFNGTAMRTPLKPGAWNVVRLEPAAGGLALLLQPGGPGALEVRYAARIERWPAGARPLPARPPEVMAFETSDSTLVTGSRRLAW